MPDLILMDVVMPGMNGYQATRTITREEATKHIPVVMCTSKGQETDKIWGMRQGANDYTRTWFRGLANVRGNLYSVVDLASFCGESLSPMSNESRMMLIGTRHGLNTALLVTRALGLRNPDDFEVDESFTDTRPWVGHALRDHQNRLWKRLIVRPLLVDPRFMDASADVR
jgi:CheY-like chemotaxis protein